MSIAAIDLKSTLSTFRTEMELELTSILRFWETNMVDESNGGFHAGLDNDNQINVDAPKGLVLNSRICWAFARGFNHSKDPQWLMLATRAFEYIVDNFIDAEYGGAFWSLDTHGKKLDDKKQTYGLAFCLYGLSEYFKASNDERALNLSIELFNIIERHAYDEVHWGYIEAFTREWGELNDLRLSDKDENQRKTTNTHLHILEAYANLYSAWPDQRLKEKIMSLLDVFDRHLINSDNNHLDLFFDDQWRPTSTLQSYGHDIEAAWLLLDCATVAGTPAQVNAFRRWAIRLADAAAEGIDEDGALWYEYDPSYGSLIREKHSWPQAEAMIGFLAAWRITGNTDYLQRSQDCWLFVQKFLHDKKNGEWFWGVLDDHTIMKKDKAGFWKCPYHNTRACIQISNTITTYLNKRNSSL